MADTDKLVKVGQLDAVADAVIEVVSDTNERLAPQQSTIDDLTLRLSEAEALLNIARGEGGS